MKRRFFVCWWSVLVLSMVWTSQHSKGGSFFTTIAADVGSGGFSVGFDGRFVVVGNAGDVTGSGIVFVRDLSIGAPSGFTFVPIGAERSNFGRVVDVYDGVAVVGANGFASILNLRLNAEVHRLVLPNSPRPDFGNFGRAVSLNSSVALVAASTYGTYNAGSVFVFDLLTGDFLRELGPSPRKDFRGFGSSLDATETHVVVGANNGTAFVFDLLSGEQLHVLIPGDDHANRGPAIVATHGKWVAVSDPTNASFTVFDINTGLEVWQRTLDDEGSGAAIAMNEDYLVVGSPRASRSGGKLYLFDLETGNGFLEYSREDAYRFGRTLALSGNTIISGHHFGADIIRFQPSPVVGLSDFSFEENAPAGTFFSQVLVAWDGASNGVLQFSLTEGAESFELVRSGSEWWLATRRSFDFEAGPQEIPIGIEMRDSTGVLDKRSFILTILDDRSEDFDGDGLTELDEELTHGTSDLVFDTDGDGIADGVEVAQGTDPNSIWLEVVPGTGEAAGGLGMGPGFVALGAPDGAGPGLVRLFDSRQKRFWGRLIAEGGSVDDRFGGSVAVHGTDVLVGAPGIGAAHLVDMTTGREALRVKPTDPRSGDVFGNIVAMSNDYLLVTAQNASLQDVVHVFDRQTGEDVVVLEGASPNYGVALAVDKGIALIGAPSNGDNGSGFVSVVDVSTQEVLSVLVQPAGSSGLFGSAVAFGDEWFVVGALGDEGFPARVYVYSRVSGELIRSLEPFDPPATTTFGRALAVDGSSLVIGSLGEGAWLYDLKDDYLVSTITRGTFGVGKLGHSVGIEGSTIAVSGTGANGRDELLFYEIPGHPRLVLDSASVAPVLPVGSEVGTVFVKGWDGDDAALDLTLVGDVPFALAREDERWVLRTTALLTGMASYSFRIQARADGELVWIEEMKVETADGGSGDFDEDGLSDAEELALGTSPWVSDSDGDGMTDGDEVALGTDPLPGTTRLLLPRTGSSEVTDDVFGASVTMKGSRLAVGAHSAFGQRGEVYLYDRDAVGEPVVLGPDVPGAFVGGSVALSADGLVAGGVGAGNVYEVGFDELEDGLVVAVEGEAAERFGISVSSEDDLLLVGAPRADDLGASSGAALVYAADDDGRLLQRLTAWDGAEGDLFGWPVVLSEGLAVVGARNDDDLGASSGSVYVFEGRSGRGMHKLVPEDGTAGDQFGKSLSVDGGLAVIGAPGRENGRGAAYVYDVSTGELMRPLERPEGVGDGDGFGHGVRVSGGHAVVSAWNEGSGFGGVWVYDVMTGDLVATLGQVAGEMEVQLGIAVAMEGNRVLVSGRAKDGSTRLAMLYELDYLGYWEADEDGDGFGRGLEVVFGMNPEVWDGGDVRAPSVRADGRGLTFGVDASALENWDVVVERSDDLEDFEEVYRVIGGEGAVVEGMRVEAMLTEDRVTVWEVSAERERYFRLRVSRR